MTTAVAHSAIEPSSAEYVKLVVRRMYDAQKLRIQSDLRMQRLVRDKIVLKEDAEKIFKKAFDLEKKTEAEYERIIWREIKDWPIVTEWLGSVKGIGPRLAGLLIANLQPIDRFPTVGKLWAYAGLHVKDGKAVRRTKGEKANWNAELKTTAWKIGNSFIKTNGPYRDLYDKYKTYLINRETKKKNIIWKKIMKPKEKWVITWAYEGLTPTQSKKIVAAQNKSGVDAPEWTMGRVNNMAIRRTAKIFLSHLWEVWRGLEGLPTREPYALEYTEHTTFLDPWDFIDEP